MATTSSRPPLRDICQVAVLGAGTMGSRIAAHIANAGVPVLLLDIVPAGTASDAPASARNRLALSALDSLRTAQPAAFYTPSAASLITPGNFDDHLPLLATCDWILEAATEDLSTKRDLLTRILPHRRPGTITTTNASSLPVHEITAGLDPDLPPGLIEDLRRHWFGTHFLYPPRYTPFVELIPTPDTDPADLDALDHFCDVCLGKTVVRSRDTPDHPVEMPAGTLSALKSANRLVKQNPGASLIDLGDNIAAIELHSKRNILGGDIVSLITQTLSPSSDALSHFEAFVITADGTDFTLGANLLQLLLAIQDDNWGEVDLMVRAFQGMTQAIKFCTRPVVVAPFGLCLGGGVEIALHAAATHPHAELYMGLVEAGVGLIPGGGGSKEMTLRSLEAGSPIDANSRGQGSAPANEGTRSNDIARNVESTRNIESPRGNDIATVEALQQNFETIVRATVSTSAAQARSLGFLRPSDTITMNRDRLLADAKARARHLADAGYTAPQPRSDIPAPGASALASLKLAIRTLHQGHPLSDHDAKVAAHVAHVLCGGPLPLGTLITEQYLLDLEREAFLSLCGEQKTQDRIAFTLKTGKPLRN
jgi:enoyl-CoA hydratase/carnithine racemase